MKTSEPFYHFVVVGRGIFPFEMLYYDRCWPSSFADACEIPGHLPRTICLSSLCEPDDSRWNKLINTHGVEWRISEKRWLE